jgi:uncharacterized Zn-binding protein involved in type VI secretion
MSQLWAVQGDADSHGGGALNADADSSPHTVFINNLPVVVNLSHAAADSLCRPQDTPHCDPYTTSGSGTVTCYGKPVHRNGDSRVCGATTVVTHQTTVFVG